MLYIYGWKGDKFFATFATTGIEAGSIIGRYRNAKWKVHWRMV